ncbi:MAG: peroxidase [Myxococcaceae bacterium]|nr:peroxidase [Myxococcaceae bacterium]MCI0673695.1 peroxidase [Myxococcaceae bacterium]
MRLSNVSHGHKFRHKLLLGLFRLIGRMEPPDVVKTSLYRPEFFGKPIGRLFHTLLRGPSEWSVGERELFAAFTSRMNACRF